MTDPLKNLSLHDQCRILRFVAEFGPEVIEAACRYHRETTGHVKLPDETVISDCPGLPATNQLRRVG